MTRQRDARGRFKAKPKAPPLDAELVRLAGEGLPPAVTPWAIGQWHLVIHSKARVDEGRN